jgi:hypothetical protein
MLNQKDDNEEEEGQRLSEKQELIDAEKTKKNKMELKKFDLDDQNNNDQGEDLSEGIQYCLKALIYKDNFINFRFKQIHGER